MKKIILDVDKNNKVLTFVSQKVPAISFSYASKCLRNKDIRVNDEKITINQDVFVGDKVTIFVDDKVFEFKPYSVIYKDENVLIVNKKAGIEVCDGDDNLLDFLLKEFRPLFAVHRIDRGTEGLVVFAKNLEAKNELDISFKSRENISKWYLAEVVGVMQKSGYVAVNYLVKDSKENSVKIYNNKVPDSERIETFYNTLKVSGGTSLIEARLITGKTHQIRAQLAYLKTPIVGDGKYGKNEENKKYKASSQKLCAYKLEFDFEKNSPLSNLSGKVIEITPSWLKY